VAAEIALRRALLPDSGLAFIEPAIDGDRAITWGAIIAALMADAGAVDVVLVRAGRNLPARLRLVRAAALVAAGLAGSRRPPELGGLAIEHAAASVRAADDTLRELEAKGWASLVTQPQGADRSGLGDDRVVVRAGAFDPLGADSARS
jgi:hypothetical protein